MATRSRMAKVGSLEKHPSTTRKQSESGNGEGSNTGRGGTSVLEQDMVPRDGAVLWGDILRDDGKGHH